MNRMMLNEFLLQNQSEILALTENKTLELAGDHPSSDQLKGGLPIFLKQVMEVIGHAAEPAAPPAKAVDAIARAADEGDEPAMAMAASQPKEAALAKSAGRHGTEMLRLGYTLSHVVHAYGAMCQAITELATKENISIEAKEFHALNRCLDVAIAGAVTTYQSFRDSQDASRKDKDFGFLAHEMRSALASANLALQLIQRGTVGIGGNTGQVLESSLKRLEELIDRSLTEGEAARNAAVRPESAA
jgi:hypothetical protein